MKITIRIIHEIENSEQNPMVQYLVVWILRARGRSVCRPGWRDLHSRLLATGARFLLVERKKQTVVEMALGASEFQEESATGEGPGPPGVEQGCTCLDRVCLPGFHWRVLQGFLGLIPIDRTRVRVTCSRLPRLKVFVKRTKTNRNTNIGYSKIEDPV